MRTGIVEETTEAKAPSQPPPPLVMRALPPKKASIYLQLESKLRAAQAVDDPDPDEA